MSNVQHTPLHVTRHNDGVGVGTAEGDKSLYVAHMVDGDRESWARRIVQCVNSHDALLQALRDIIDTDVLSPEGGYEAVAECHCIARAAISKATGEQS